MELKTSRLLSIDVTRAVIMFFMIFVNDVDGVTNIPNWIGHVDASADGMGFADTIFPAFLFIVGLSIPLALNKRIQLDESKKKVTLHILTRSLALIVMGFFHVNLENYSDASLLPEPVFEIMATIAFFLIWLDYPKKTSPTMRTLLQVSGVAVLVVLFFLYKGEMRGHTDTVGMRHQWWGILGLIGWAYLTCSLVYLFSKGRLGLLIYTLILFLIYNILNQTEILEPVSGILKYLWPFNNGSEISLIMAGVITSTFHKNYFTKNKQQFFLLMFVSIIIMLVFGFATRPFGGISKIRATPSWGGICIAISIALFTIMVFVIDIKQKAKWFTAIKPAGTSTLTCYLIPYFLYSFFIIVNFQYPQFLDEGIGGIVRSFAIAFLVIFITGILEKRYIRLKI